ncbi:hypothetical protein L798_13389 [Zootermopsis nevadensis]|uniref:Uncharacterized protein n=1 Tax=Zootermopsis nevadensis TaxID=136037 RepID=A0A067QTS5_ZOONE|nr:hypothetical protein L798_13389 [Zootermopsis nevadensis]
MMLLLLNFAGGRGCPDGGGRRTCCTVHHFARSLLSSSSRDLGFRCRCLGISVSFSRLCHTRRPTCKSREFLRGLLLAVSTPDDGGRGSLRNVKNISIRTRLIAEEYIFVSIHFTTISKTTGHRKSRKCLLGTISLSLPLMMETQTVAEILET